MRLDKKKHRKSFIGNEKLKIAIIVSNFNKVVTDKLLKGAKKALIENGVNEKNIKVFRAPGAFEIPVITASLLQPFSPNDKVDGIIALGCLIKGETAHFDYISSSVSTTLNQLSAKEITPIGFGILTCYTKQQALDRCKINPITADDNKGYESAIAVLETIDLIRKNLTDIPF